MTAAYGFRSFAQIREAATRTRHVLTAPRLLMQALQQKKGQARLQLLLSGLEYSMRLGGRTDWKCDDEPLHCRPLSELT